MSQPNQPWNQQPNQPRGASPGNTGEQYGQAPQQYPSDSYGAPGQPYGSSQPYGQPTQPYGQPVQPYGQPAEPYGQAPQQFGPPQPYGQPGPYGAGGWVPPAAPAPKRPVWRTVLGWVFVGLTVLFTLSALRNLAGGGSQLAGNGAAYAVGYVIGMLVAIGLPALAAWLLLRRKR